MIKMKTFIRTTLLGGLVVILPITIMLFVFGWLFGQTTNLIQPLTNAISHSTGLPELVGDVLAIAAILTVCFLVGVVVKTRTGRYIQHSLESKVLKLAPGYNFIKETVLHLLGKSKSPFSSVALVNLYDSETMATAFVTEQHENGMYTVFVPTGPNPTSGQIFHLKSEHVHPVDVSVEETMRSIIACGATSTKMIEQFNSGNPAVQKDRPE